MPSRPKQGSKEPQNHSVNTGTGEGEKTPPTRNKRDREDLPVQTSTAVTPEAKKGTIVSYMSGNALLATPRRGEGKKKNRSTESMDDGTEEKEIQNNFDAIRKAEAAAEQTIREMGIAAEKESTSPPTQKEHSNSQDNLDTEAEKNNDPPDNSETEDNTPNPASDTGSQKRNPRRKIRRRGKPPKRSKKETDPHSPSRT